MVGCVLCDNICVPWNENPRPSGGKICAMKVLCSAERESPYESRGSRPLVEDSRSAELYESLRTSPFGRDIQCPNNSVSSVSFFLCNLCPNNSVSSVL